ncbi:MAG: FKBP-type peptidyl-prolyl cis-trans isomerase [Bacteroidales bacterium]|nr:FKBP-type peptidyl-prolyl cis-trans isomerase [Bacteroidales bacterium]
MKIEKNAFVTLTYELRLEGKEGPLVEKTDTATPLRFIYGAGRMLPMFEKHIDGLEMGSKFEFSIPCADAYGEKNPEAIVDVPKSIFVVDGALREDLLQLGHTIPMMGANGQHMSGVVLEITDSTVKMDFNHPLAGEDLFFSGDIIEVREATAEELVGGCCGGGGCGGGCCGGCGSDGGCGGGCQ